MNLVLKTFIEDIMLVPTSPSVDVARDSMYCPPESQQQSSTPQAAPRVFPPQPKPRSGDDLTN